MVVKSRGMTLSELRKKLDTEELKELNLIIKADVQGSVEAVKGMLEKVANDEVEAKVILSGVGSITESDILLASAAERDRGRIQRQARTWRQARSRAAQG